MGGSRLEMKNLCLSQKHPLERPKRMRVVYQARGGEASGMGAPIRTCAEHGGSGDKKVMRWEKGWGGRLGSAWEPS